MSVEVLVAGEREPARPSVRLPHAAIAALCLALLVLAGSLAERPPAAVPGVGSYDPGPQYQPLLGRPLR